MTTQEVLSRLLGVKGGRGQWTARCPAHDDTHNSLSVSTGQDGRILLNCHAGCSAEAVAGALGLSVKDLFADRPQKQDKPRVTAIYEYPGGVQKLRYSDKHFGWRRPDGNGGWIWNRQGVRPSLYIAGELTGAVFVCEGEKDADNLHRVGWNAVSGADGAGEGKWKPEYTETLKGLHVCIFQDNDEIGKAYAQETANALHGKAVSVQLLDLSLVWPEIPEHGDVSDLLDAFGDVRACEMISRLISQTPEWEPGSFVGSVGFVSETGQENENGFCGYCGFCGPDLKKNPQFPATEFPRVLRNFAVNASDSLRVSVDMTSVSVLTVSSLCAQRKFMVHIRGNWYEPVNLYAVIVANPSERKSAELSLAMTPVYRYQHEENERRRPHVEEYNTRHDMLQRRIESMKKSASSGRKAKNDSPATVDDIMLLYREMEDLERGAVNYVSLTADDITMEALASEMAANHETMSLVSSEGGIFNVLSGLYSGGIVNIDIILKAWSGDHVKVNRKGRQPETLSRPSLVILLMIQPRVLEAVMKRSILRGVD